ncbi:MAG: C4-dicarboxylate ABC transporter [Desulfobacterium sp.]|nr:C4-dicarboxylate ABC transporter [Desulfobacterium sp.]
MTTLIVLVITLMAIMGAPVFIVLSAFAMLGFYMTEIPLAAIIVDLYSNFSSQPLLYTIPLFTFAGYILAESKTSIRLVNFSSAILGWLPGGLAIVALVTCAFFTAFTGASGVTIIALGGLLYPAMIKEKYPEKFSLGLLTSSGSLGLLFPPSLPIILFGVVSEASINQLFAAGLLPGIFLIILLSLYGIFIGKRDAVVQTKFHFAEVLRTANKAKWELFIPVIVAVGIYGGFFTLGEIASITVAYSIIVEVFIQKDIRISQIPSIMKRSMILVGGILVILGGAYGLTNYLIDAEIPMLILDSMRVYITSKFLFLLTLNIFLLIVGCVLDIFSAILVTVPLILPIAESYGINPVHLGIIFLTNLEIGYSTPPVGMNLFIASFRFNKSVLTLYRSTIPFLVILFIALMFITYMPQLSLWLVDYLHIK